MIRFKQFYEARRNPELNPKIGIVKALEPYKNDPDVYISFRDINKIGINPFTKFNTPNGIYTYPLKEMWKNVVNNTIPYAGERPLVYVVKLKSKKGFVNDMYKDYGSNDYDKDMKKLIKLYGKNKNIDVESIISIATLEAKHKNPITSMWNVTRMLGEHLYKNNPAQGWNNILSKLGYTGFADKSGKGIIHHSEPIQAVFLTKEAFKVIGAIENKRYDTKFNYWKNGTWEKGVWQDGTWLNGTWKEGTWKDGTWKDGIWERGTWHKGTWERGNHNIGYWYSGTWNNGTWKNGTWEDGIWKWGVWKDGEWLGGYDSKGNFHPKGDSPDKWKTKKGANK